MATFKELQRSECTSLQELEVGIKNTFRWSWLEEKDKNGTFLSDYIRKINIPGKVLCSICNVLLSYKNSGKKDLKNHSKNKSHKEKINIAQTNTTLSSIFTKNKVVSTCTLPYGTALNVHDEQACASKIESSVKKSVGVEDRIAHAEAMVLSFVAEHSLPFCLTPAIIRLSQVLAKDNKVLTSLSMAGCTASYKLRHGLAAHIADNIKEDLRKSYFSINVDECLNNAHEKVFSILVSYYSENQMLSVVQHYHSKSFTVINAKILFDYIKSLFLNDEIPTDNLISNLSDSTNYMRGKKTGFETLLRLHVPHLLDIDGDMCHHMHNTVKRFLAPFEKYIEYFCKDVHNDLKWSPDIRNYLSEICGYLGVNYRMPPDHIDHRWLSTFDAIECNMALFPALSVLYFFWLKKEEQTIYMDDYEKLTENLSNGVKKRIYSIGAKCKKKSLTEAGKERKKRIVSKLFYKRRKTELHANFYIAILPIFKSFILIFEQKEPKIHILYDELKSVVKSFLGCFMKLELIKDASGKKLTMLDVTDFKFHKIQKDWYIGKNTNTALLKFRLDDPIRTEFESHVKRAFLDGAKYIQKKIPLSNELLKLLSSIDPTYVGSTVACRMTQKLKEFFPNIIKIDEADLFDREVVAFHLAKDLPAVKGKRLDQWWSEVFVLNRYNLLTKVIKACLSIFTGPMIEQSFSTMNDDNPS
nr:uncharacterized protein LOC124815724 [Hydra vulgaris]